MEAYVWIALMGFIIFCLWYMRWAWHCARAIEKAQREAAIAEVRRLKEEIISNCKRNQELMDKLSEGPKEKVHQLMNRIQETVNEARLEAVNPKG